MAIFVGIAVFCTVFGGVIIVLLKPLNKLTHGAEDFELPDGVEAGEEPAH